MKDGGGGGLTSKVMTTSGTSLRYDYRDVVRATACHVTRPTDRADRFVQCCAPGIISIALDIDRKLFFLGEYTVQ